MSDDLSLSSQRNSKVQSDQQLWDFPRPSNNTFLQWEQRNTELLFQSVTKIFLASLRQLLPDWGDVFEVRYELKGNDVLNHTKVTGSTPEIVLVLNKNEVPVTYDQ